MDDASHRRPVKRMSQWSRELRGDLNQTLTLETVRRSILPLLWWLMGCEHVKERADQERERDDRSHVVRTPREGEMEKRKGRIKEVAAGFPAAHNLMCFRSRIYDHRLNT